METQISITVEVFYFNCTLCGDVIFSEAERKKGMCKECKPKRFNRRKLELQGFLDSTYDPYGRVEA